MTTKIATILRFGAVVLVFSGPCLAQQKDGTSQCSTEYENHNQIDYGPLRVHTVQGTSIIQLAPPLKGAPTQPGPPSACLVLFTEKDHKMVTSVKADSKGSFELRDVAPGRYRLIARAEGFCTANIPVEVIKSSRQKAEIVVYFRPTGMDVCSTGELAAPKADGTKSTPTTRNPKATTP